MFCGNEIQGRGCNSCHSRRAHMKCICACDLVTPCDDTARCPASVDQDQVNKGVQQLPISKVPNEAEEGIKFEHLPNELKLHVFQFLTPCERGVAARVCSDWWELARVPSLWTVIDLSCIQFCNTLGSKSSSTVIGRTELAGAGLSTLSEDESGRVVAEGYLVSALNECDLLPQTDDEQKQVAKTEHVVKQSRGCNLQASRQSTDLVQTGTKELLSNSSTCAEEISSSDAPGCIGNVQLCDRNVSAVCSDHRDSGRCSQTLSGCSDCSGVSCNHCFVVTSCTTTSSKSNSNMFSLNPLTGNCSVDVNWNSEKCKQDILSGSSCVDIVKELNGEERAAVDAVSNAATCYDAYKHRVHKFLRFLSEDVHPSVRVLRIALDIGDMKDAWMDAVVGLLNGSCMHCLHTAHIVWNRTPAKSLSLDSLHPFSPACLQFEDQVSFDDYQPLSVDAVHKLRHTQRRFVNLFELLVKVAPSIQRLALPFDWSNRSLDLLCRLRFLHTLVLHRYSVYQQVASSMVSKLLASLPVLVRLNLELWLTSGLGVTGFWFSSRSLKYLDVSRCCGIYVVKLDLPVVEVVKLSRRPWNDCSILQLHPHQAKGHSENAEKESVNPEEAEHVWEGAWREEEVENDREQSDIECVWDMLSRGAPRLRQLNDHVLHSDWIGGCYGDLDLVLDGICLCRFHSVSYRKDWTV